MPFSLPLILIPLLGGFIFVTYCHRTKWYAVRADKERLLIYALLAGFVHLGAAWVITSFVPLIPCSPRFPCFADSWATWLHWWMGHRPPFNYSGTALLAFGTAFASAPLLNTFWYDRDAE